MTGAIISATLMGVAAVTTVPGTPSAFVLQFLVWLTYLAPTALLLTWTLGALYYGILGSLQKTSLLWYAPMAIVFSMAALFILLQILYLAHLNPIALSFTLPLLPLGATVGITTTLVF